MEIDVLIQLLVEKLQEEKGRSTDRPSHLAQVGDAVANSSLVVASAPAMSQATLDLSTSTSLGMSAYNATTAQAGATTQLHASTVLAVNRIQGGGGLPGGLNALLLAALQAKQQD